MDNKTNFKKIENSINNLSFSERVSRLVLMTAILGGLSLFYIKILKLIVNNLTNKIYLQSIINTEHILASAMLSSGIIILACAVWYCYCELLTLNHVNKTNSTSKKIIQNSENSYSFLFTVIKLCLILSAISTMISIITIAIIVKNYFVIGFFLFLILIFGIMIFHPKTKKSVIKKEILRFFKTNKIVIFIWLIITFFAFFIIFLSMGAHQKETFNIHFTNASKIPIEFHFKNSVPDNISLSFYSIDEQNKMHLTKETKISKSDFKTSYIEVTEQQPESVSNFSWLNTINKELKKNQEAAFISNVSRYDFKYEFNSLEYLKTGRNFVVIKFKSISGLNDNFYNLGNEIDISEQGVSFTTKSFE